MQFLQLTYLIQVYFYHVYVLAFAFYSHGSPFSYFHQVNTRELTAGPSGARTVKPRAQLEEEMKTLKTQAIIAYGLSVLVLGLLAVPGSALAATHHHRTHQAQTQQQAPQSPPPCTIHFQTGCSGL